MCVVCDGMAMKTLAASFAEVDFEAFVAGDFHGVVVEAELVEEGGVDVGDVVAAFLGLKTDLVGAAMGDAAFDSAAGHPDGEAVGMMVAAIGGL